MKRRMDKYYQDESKTNTRAKKNTDLYNTVYNLEPISEVVSVDDIKEINLHGETKQYKSRAEYQRLKSYQTLVEAPYEREEEPVNSIFEEEINHDINSILERAKEERTETDIREKYRKLRNTQYNILNNLDLSKDIDEYTQEIESAEEKLKDLIHTITMNKREINAIRKKDDTNNLLSDMMTQSLGDMIEKAEKENDEIKEIDKSFYSSFCNFTKDDFEKEKADKTPVKSNGLVRRLLIFVIVALIITFVWYLVSSYVDFNAFKL
ncbi:MAG: hypothetical protein ACOXZW_02185 [Bacilli bacterium]|jgi:hypothetical protein